MQRAPSALFFSQSALADASCCFPPVTCSGAQRSQCKTPLLLPPGSGQSRRHQPQHSALHHSAISSKVALLPSAKPPAPCALCWGLSSSHSPVPPNEYLCRSRGAARLYASSLATSVRMCDVRTSWIFPNWHGELSTLRWGHTILAWSAFVSLLAGSLKCIHFGSPLTCRSSPWSCAHT